jgi:hypothetical protein
MPKPAPVRKDETIDEFVARWNGVTLQQLIDLNGEEDHPLHGRSLAGSGSRPLGRKQWLDGVKELLVPDAATEKNGAPVVAPEPPQAPEPLFVPGPPVNAGYHWLTWETIFNQRPYRKTNQRQELGLYRIPLFNVKVFVRENVPPATLEELSSFFFPDLEWKNLDRMSASYWPWKKRTAPVIGGIGASAPVRVGRNESVLYKKQYVVMPYNFLDNGPESHAIGHSGTTELGNELDRLKPRWSFWKTASRSLYVQLSPVKKKDRPWQPILEDAFEWPAASAPSLEKDFGLLERGTNLREAVDQTHHFDLSAAAPGSGIHGVKTGVQYVGNIDQQPVHKDKLEENSIIACLRSDLIVEMDQLAGRKEPAKDADLLIQTELLSITEIRDNPAIFGDGVQVRDLSVLDVNKIYLPPISIPFIGTDLKTMKRRFEGVTDPQWRAFFGEHYAKRLGRAKAILLLRYGLQMGSPNAQNCLVEFNKPAGQAAPVPTGRIVLRDVGDMYLHREVLWARFGGEGPPPVGSGEKMKMKTLKSKIIQYECNVLSQKASAAEEWRDYVPYETGSLYETSYGPSGTRFLWHRFSTLSKGSSVNAPSKLGTDPDAYSAGWRLVLATMCEWGLEHNKAYVKFVQDHLGLDCGIDWTTAPAPDRYRNLQANDKGQADVLYKADLKWEDEAANKLHAVLAGAAGQKKLRETPPP